jgi:hypothetical protein
LGEATRRKIEETHWGNNWQRSLEDLYSNAMSLPKIATLSDVTDEFFLSEPDIFLPLIHKTSIAQVFQWHMTLLPLIQRLKLWFNLVKKNGLRNTPSSLLLSEWLRSRYYLFHSR